MTSLILMKSFQLIIKYLERYVNFIALPRIIGINSINIKTYLHFLSFAADLETPFECLRALTFKQASTFQ
jgi:hypothetical protein